MGYLKIVAVSVLALVILFGCSKKKEEAEKLEQEMMAQSTATDSGPAASAEEPSATEPLPPEQPARDTSTAAQAETPPDAQAVPREEGSQFAPTKVEGKGWTVQVAGCESLKYAQHLSQLFTQRGYDPYITEFQQDGKTVYRVRIGKFEARAAASLLKSELADKYSVQAWVDAL